MSKRRKQDGSSSKDSAEPPLRRRKNGKRPYPLLAAGIMAGIIIWLIWSSAWGQEDKLPVLPDDARVDVLKSLVLIFVLVIAKAFFSLSETAIVSVRRSRLRQLVEQGKSSALVVEQLLKNPPKFLATIQIGIEIVSAFASVEAGLALAKPFQRWLWDWIQLPDAVAVAIVTLGVVFFAITIGEIIPKSIAMLSPENWAMRVARTMSFLSAVLAFPVWIISGVANLFIKRFGGVAHYASPIITEEELKVIVETSEEHGVLEEDESEIIKSVFEFTDTIAREVMTPRTELVATDINSSVDTIVKIIKDTGYSRIPVYEETIDNVVGIVHAKDILHKIIAGSDFILKDVARPAMMIPENKSVVLLLKEMRQNRVQAVIVRDEYGGTAGLVTIEDLVEELVGDIMDEYDDDEHPATIETLSDNIYVVEGRMHLDDINDQLNLNLESEEFDTVGGLVFGLLGHQPEQGEEVVFDSVRFIVEATDGRRIQKVKLERINNEVEDVEEEMNKF